MLKVGLLCVVVAMAAACASARYQRTPELPIAVNMSRGIHAVTVNLVDGEHCLVSVKVFGDSAGQYVGVFPRELCEKADTAQRAIMSIPTPVTAPAITKPQAP